MHIYIVVYIHIYTCIVCFSWMICWLLFLFTCMPMHAMSFTSCFHHGRGWRAQRPSATTCSATSDGPCKFQQRCGSRIAVRRNRRLWRSAWFFFWWDFWWMCGRCVVDVRSICDRFVVDLWWICGVLWWFKGFTLYLFWKIYLLVQIIRVVPNTPGSRYYWDAFF